MRSAIDNLDVLIIGSGFGGAFAADALVKAGMNVALAERGPWRETQQVRAAGIAQCSPLPIGRHATTHLVRRISAPWLPASGINPNTRGLYELHLDREMTVLCSSGVGGGSHVYGAINTRPPAVDYWDKRAAGVDSTGMAQHYDAVIARMGARSPAAGDGIPNFPDSIFANDPNFTAEGPFSQPAMGFRFQQENYQSNNGVFGSVDGSKVTLDALLLAPSVERGLTLLDMHEAVGIGRTAKGSWWVAIRDHRTGQYRHLVAPQLVLAAGTINTLRLLFANRARGALGSMTALGKGFSGNGDLFAWWARNDAHANYSVGTPCHGRFALRGNEDGPELLTAGINLDGLPLPRALSTRLKRDIVLMGLAEEAVAGVATWRKDRLHLAYDQKSNPGLAQLHSIYERIAHLSGRPVYSIKKFPATVHPIGGARVDANPEQGVVDGHGQVHGLPGLFIADASVLPESLGTPPSMSVAAWARHVATGMCTLPRMANSI